MDYKVFKFFTVKKLYHIVNIIGISPIMSGVEYFYHVYILDVYLFMKLCIHGFAHFFYQILYFSPLIVWNSVLRKSAVYPGNSDIFTVAFSLDFT